jgi:hypothetical protein
MNNDEILHKLLVQFVMLKEDHSVMRLVLQSLIQSHQNRAVLLSRFNDLAKVREEVDLSQPMDDQTLERRKQVIATWRESIESGPFL